MHGVLGDHVAEQGYITELACKMPTCFCPEELGGATYSEAATAGLSDWMPAHEHFPVSKQDGGTEAVDNAILAHRLCNRLDYSIRAERSHARDLERIRKAREDAIARNWQDLPQRSKMPPSLDCSLSRPDWPTTSSTDARTLTSITSDLRRSGRRSWKCSQRASRVCSACIRTAGSGRVLAVLKHLPE